MPSLGLGLGLRFVRSIKLSSSPPALPYLKLTQVSIDAASAYVTNINSVAEWNTLLGSTFTSVTVSGLVITLNGVSDYNEAVHYLGDVFSSAEVSQCTPFIVPQATSAHDRIQADGGVSNASKINFWIFITNSITSKHIQYSPQSIGYKPNGTDSTKCEKLYSLTGASEDLVQTTIGQMPTVLPHTGRNYYFNCGNDANNATTDNSPENAIVDNISFEVEYAPLSWTPSSKQTFLSKDRNVNGIKSYRFGLNTDGTLYLSFSIDGNTTLISNSTATTGFTGNTLGRLGFERNATTGIIKFWKFVSNAWVQIGANVSNTSGDIFDSDTSLVIGTNSSIDITLTGNIYKATLYSGLFVSDNSNATVGALFNPENYSEAVSQNTVPSTSGNWTMNTDVDVIGYNNVLVDKSLLIFDGVDDIIGRGIASNSTFSCAARIRFYESDDSHPFIGRGDDPGLFDFLNRGFNLSILGNNIVAAGQSNNIIQDRGASVNTGSRNITGRIDNNSTVTETGALSGVNLPNFFIGGSAYAYRFGSVQYNSGLFVSFLGRTAESNNSDYTQIFKGLNSISYNTKTIPVTIIPNPSTPFYGLDFSKAQNSGYYTIYF